MGTSGDDRAAGKVVTSTPGDASTASDVVCPTQSEGRTTLTPSAGTVDGDLQTRQSSAQAPADKSAGRSPSLISEAESRARHALSEQYHELSAMMESARERTARADVLGQIATGPEAERWAAIERMLAESAEHGIDGVDEPTGSYSSATVMVDHDHQEYRDTVNEIESICDSYIETMDAGDELMGRIDQVLVRLLKIEQDGEAEPVEASLTDRDRPH